MSEINVVVLSCRIASDPDICDFPNGGRVFQCRVVGPGQPYKDNAGMWKRRPVFLDLKAWNRGNARLADLCFDRLKKGDRAIVHALIVADEWVSAGGEKRSRLVLDVQEIEFVD